jgi:hypothetical protein
MTARARPNYFIAGASRCGTTSLFAWLGQHPQVHNSRIKEPSFFSHNPERRSLDEYLELFEGAGVGHRAIGEASANYFETPEAATRISRFDPEARILICLREPIARIQSLYRYRRTRGIETRVSLDEVLRAELEGGDETPFYVGRGSYLEGVGRFLDAFGRDRVRVVLMQDLMADPVPCYRATLEFLGLDARFVPELEAHNASRGVRFGSLQARIVRPPAIVSRVAAGLLSRRLRHRLSVKLRRLNTRPVVREELAADLRAALQDLFRADIQALSALIDRDLSSWSGPA